MIGQASINDWNQIKQIYIEGIETDNATFETAESIPKSGEMWFGKKIDNSIFFAEENNEILGWSALSPVSDRCAYRGVAEVSVYVKSSAQGKGLGKLLLNKLIEFAEQNNIWTLQAGIFKENETSIKLHEKCGFRIVGIREKLGQLKGVWRDVVLMERRSTTIL
ncbi:MAG: GNAT family N-acetyltransferase [Ignavibacteria bacterium]|jgi:phosphinothricin acetyltransferase